MTNDERWYDAALRLLAARPRSVAEVRQRLRRRGAVEQEATEAIARLHEEGLLDDAAFAAYWRENRETFRPRSRRLLQAELRQKGVEAEVVRAALTGLDEDEQAYRAGLRRVRSLEREDEVVFRRRLEDYLRRRGFGYEVAVQAVRRLWAEAGGGAAPGSPASELENSGQRTIDKGGGVC